MHTTKPVNVKKKKRKRKNHAEGKKLDTKVPNLHDSTDVNRQHELTRKEIRAVLASGRRWISWERAQENVLGDRKVLWVFDKIEKLVYLKICAFH